MKIRIQDNSIRFRITLAELEELNAQSRLESVCQTFTDEGEVDGRFVYGVTAVAEGTPSRCVVGTGAIFLHLSPKDMAQLNDASQEGVYLKKEVRLPGGETIRSIAFIEKDRPSTKCDKPEEWVYEHRVGGRPETRPIAPPQTHPS